MDDILRKRLRQAEVPPPSFVWTGVEAELRRRRRRRFFFWFTTGASVLTLAGLAWLTWTPAATPQQLSSTTSEIIAAPPVQQPAAAPVTSFNPARTADPSSAAAVSPISIISVAKPAFSSTTQQASEQNTPSAPTAIATPPNAHNASPTTETPSYTTAISLNSNSIGATTAPAADADAPTTPRAVSATAPSLALAVQPEAPVTVSAESQPAIQTVKAPAAQPSVAQTGTLVKSTLSGPNHPMTRKKKEHNKHCFDFAEHRNAWLFDAYVGPSMTRKSIEATSAEWASFRDNRNQTERSSFAFNGGLRATFVFREQFLLRAGVHYDQFTEVFEYVDPTSIQYIISQIYDPNTGSWTIDTIDINYGEEYTKTFNRFGLLDVPVELGYELRTGRTGVSLNAGLSANVLFWKRGAALNQSGDAAYFTPGSGNEQQVFKTRTGLSAQASAQWFWHYSPRTRFFAEPYYRRILRPVTLANYPLEQRYGTFGLKMGITRIF